MAALIVFSMPPVYTAKATLLIERQAPQALDVGEVLASQPVGPDEYDFYRTQYEILKSRRLAARVIVEQSLENHDQFAQPPDAGLITSLWATVTSWLGQIATTDKETKGTKPTYPWGVNPVVVREYQKRLTIDPVSRTRLVEVAFETSDPELSAQIANAHAEAFIRQGLELRTQATEDVRQFLEGKLVELKKRVEKSEATLNRYRQQKGIISLDDRENVVVDRLVDLNKLLTEAEAERIALEAQVRLIRKRDYDALPAVLNSTLIQTLKGELTKLEGDYASLSAQFKPGFPRLDQLKAQVEETRKRLSQEVRKVVGGIESAYLAMEAKENKLREKMTEQKSAALKLKDASVEYAILSREVDTNRQLYDSVLQRIKEIGIMTQFRSSNITIIDKAVPPLKPSKPKKTLSLLLGALLGLMGGLSLTVFLEYLDNTVKTPEEVKLHFQLPNLGVVPDFLSLVPPHDLPGIMNRNASGTLKPRRRSAKVEDDKNLPNKPRRRRSSRSLALIAPGIPNNHVSTKDLSLSPYPFAVILEAYRTVRTSLLLSRANTPPKTLLFASGTPGEGKTVTVLNTAIVLAQMGARVLVIDADLRNANCHKLLGTRNRLGLTEILTGQRNLHELIQPTLTQHLFFLSSGSIPPDPAELLGSRKMQEILTALQEQYDYILIDSPPVMPVSDAVLLATMMDGVILVINSQKTPRYIVKETRARLDYARAKILGVVLNKVHMQTSSYAYYYGDYVSYYPVPEDAEKKKQSGSVNSI